jgi:hypothetical protein
MEQNRVARHKVDSFWGRYQVLNIAVASRWLQQHENGFLCVWSHISIAVNETVFLPC